MGSRLLQSTKRFTTYSSYTIELKLSRMIQDICPHIRLASGGFFVFLPRGAAGRDYWNFSIESQPTVIMRLNLNLVRWYSTSVRTILRSRISQVQEEEVRISNLFCGRHLYMFPCLAVAKISSIWLKTAASVGAILHFAIKIISVIFGSRDRKSQNQRLGYVKDYSLV